MLKKISNIISGIFREKKKSSTRSPKWRSVRNDFLKEHASCAVCGSKTLLQVHHIKPFAEHPELELNADNLITLCMFSNACHLEVGHGGCWDSYNPQVAQDVTLIKNGVCTLGSIQKKAHDNRLHIK